MSRRATFHELFIVHHTAFLAVLLTAGAVLSPSSPTHPRPSDAVGAYAMKLRHHGSNGAISVSPLHHFHSKSHVKQQRFVVMGTLVVLAVAMNMTTLAGWDLISKNANTAQQIRSRTRSFDPAYVVADSGESEKHLRHVFDSVDSYEGGQSSNEDDNIYIDSMEDDEFHQVDSFHELIDDYVVEHDAGRTGTNTTTDGMVPAATLTVKQEHQDSNGEYETAYCVVGTHSAWPGVIDTKRYWGWSQSVAHSGEVLLPCWSWFVSQNATERCGFVFLDGMLRHKPISWAQHLLDHMNCTMRELGDGQNATDLPSDVRLWYDNEFEEESWLRWEGSSAAAALRHKVLLNANSDGSVTSNDTTVGDSGLGVGPLPTDESSKLLVGIVLRTGSRQFPNVTKLMGALQGVLGAATNVTDTIPTASPSSSMLFSSPLVEYSLQNMGDLSLTEQARWFATKHIIIASHGAALVNAVFLRPGSTVIHLYPKDYYFTGYFESLVRQVGGLNMDWYDGDKATALDVHKQMGINRREKAKRAEYINIVESEVASLALSAAQRYYKNGVPRPSKDDLVPLSLIPERSRAASPST